MARSNKSKISQGNGYLSRKWWMGIIGMALLTVLFFLFPAEVVKTAAFPILFIVAVYIAFQSWADTVAEKYGAREKVEEAKEE